MKKQRLAGTGQVSKEKGDAFEQEVADIFRCIPNAVVETHVKLAGKDVDIYVVSKETFGNKRRIVIDAKDYGRPMTRDQVAQEYASYRPVLDLGKADQFMLVTRHGIVSNAKQIFDNKSTVHITVSELSKNVVDPSILLQDMKRGFTEKSLSSYYVRARTEAVDLKMMAENYDTYYNDFITDCLSLGISDLQQASEAWKLRDGSKGKKLPEHYTEVKFKEVLAIRRKRGDLRDLEEIVVKWLNDDTYSIGIALLGTYGTGKSSFSKRMAYKASEDFLSGNSNRIPLLIELRHFGSHQSIEGLITHTLVNKHQVSNGSFSLFKQMNEQGRYFLILDGFDEMKQGLTKDALRYNFSEINSLCVGKARVMLCGRPTMFESEEEKSALLSGGSTVDLPNRARYVPLEIALLSREDILDLITKYTQTPEVVGMWGDLSPKIQAVRDETKTNKELTDLLSRPVHIPMFVTILPEYAGSVSLLTRGYLYSTFVEKVISREVMRLDPAYQNRYSTEQRFRFVGSLALEMARKGEARSIRRSEIPANIIEPFVKAGENVEIASRDLVAACFLEQKAPDILIFGHKSFLEFLTAHYIWSSIRTNQQTVGELVYPSPEIASFFFEICNTSDLDKFHIREPDFKEFLVEAVVQSLDHIVVKHSNGSNLRSILILRNTVDSAALRQIFSEPFLKRFCSETLSKESANRLGIVSAILSLTSIKEKSPSDTAQYKNPVELTPSAWNIVLELELDDDVRGLIAEYFYSEKSYQNKSWDVVRVNIKRPAKKRALKGRSFNNLLFVKMFEKVFRNRQITKSNSIPRPSTIISKK